MAIQGMPKTHMYVSASHPLLGDSAGGRLVKFATLAAIVAVFGVAIYFLMGRSAPSPVAAGNAPASSAKADDSGAGQAAPQPAVQASTQDTAAATPSAAERAQVPQASSAMQATAAPVVASAETAQTQTTAAPPVAVDSSAPARFSAQDRAPVTEPAAPRKTHAIHRPAKPAEAAAPAQTTADAQVYSTADAASTLNPWWSIGGTESFRITAVSPVQGQQALAVAFSAPVDAEAAQHLRLLNNDGSPAAGSWSPGANAGVLVRKDLAPGRYILFIDGAVASTNGRALGVDLSGPAYLPASR